MRLANYVCTANEMKKKVPRHLEKALNPVWIFHLHSTTSNIRYHLSQRVCPTGRYQMTPFSVHVRSRLRWQTYPNEKLGYSFQVYDSLQERDGNPLHCQSERECATKRDPRSAQQIRRSSLNGLVSLPSLHPTQRVRLLCCATRVHYTLSHGNHSSLSAQSEDLPRQLEHYDKCHFRLSSVQKKLRRLVMLVIFDRGWLDCLQASVLDISAEQKALSYPDEFSFFLCSAHGSRLRVRVAGQGFYLHVQEICQLLMFQRVLNPRILHRHHGQKNNHTRGQIAVVFQRSDWTACPMVERTSSSHHHLHHFEHESMEGSSRHSIHQHSLFLLLWEISNHAFPPPFWKALFGGCIQSKSVQEYLEGICEIWRG